MAGTDDEVALLKAESDRVQMALGVFYQENDTRNFTVDDIPNFFFKIPTSEYMDVRVRIGSGSSPLHCTRLELVLKMLSTPSGANIRNRWWLLLLRYFPTSINHIIINNTLFTLRDCCVKGVESNPHDDHLWSALGEQFDNGSDDIIVINESNFTARVAMDVARVWDNLEDVLAEGAQAFEKGAITALGRPYSQKDCFAKVVELDSLSEKGWVSLASTMSRGETVRVNNALLSTKDCVLKMLEINPLNSDAWWDLGAAIGLHESVQVSGVPHTHMTCFIKSLEINN